MATYYVSSSGNDSNNGTSPATSWKTITKVNATILNAGDTVLFNGGDIFSGNILINRSGSSTSPITISSYGTGYATISCGDSYGILIQDADYVAVTNLIISGSGPTLSGQHSATWTSTTAGIRIITTTTQITANSSYRNGITINNCTVTGCYIGIQATNTAGALIGPYPVGFNGLSITNCIVHDCGLVGIVVDGTINLISGTTAYNKYTYVANCTVYNIYGDSAFTTSWSGSGILMGMTNNGLIERCVAYNCGQANNSSGGNGPVGIWFFETTNCIIQHCEVYNQRTGATPSDGGAYDFDGGTQNCIIQYCYSHDNEGTAIISGTYAGSDATHNNTYRYNISQNDGRRIGESCYREFGSPTATILHNNLFYADSAGASTPNLFGTYTAASLYNNILFASGTSYMGVFQGTLSGNLYWFGNNPFDLFYGATHCLSLANLRTAGQETGTGINADPQLTSPGNGTTMLPINQPGFLTSYDTTSSSPAIGAAVNMRTSLGIDPGPLDFHGYPIPYGTAYDIGPVEYNAGSLLSSSSGGEYLVKL